MKHYKLGVVAVMLSLFLSACASGPGKTGWYDQWGACAAAGGAVGIAAGATDEFSTAMAAGAGAFLIGGAICAYGDTDADGVKNYKDDCRGTVAGGIVDERGCEIDSDGDGVVDRLDKCPIPDNVPTVDRDEGLPPFLLMPIAGPKPEKEAIFASLFCCSKLRL